MKIKRQNSKQSIGQRWSQKRLKNILTDRDTTILRRKTQKIFWIKAQHQNVWEAEKTVLEGNLQYWIHVLGKKKGLKSIT